MGQGQTEQKQDLTAADALRITVEIIPWRAVFL